MGQAVQSGRTLPPGPRGIPILGVLPALRRDPTAVFMQAARRFGDVAYLKIGSRRGFLITNPADVRHVISQLRNTPSGDGDLLSMLLSARDEETGEAMTDEQLRVEVTTFLLAGQETTSLALTWTWYLLSQHPESQRRLEEEIDTVLDGRAPEYADLVNLPYTRMVIDEAMRLYPPAWGFSRQALSDDELGGFHLPRGWLAFVIPYVLHRLPAFWPDPDAFDPERFLPERSADRPKFVYAVRRRTTPVHR